MPSYFALGVPFATLLLILIATMVSTRATLNDLHLKMRAGFSDLRGGFGSRTDGIEKRLDLLNTEIRLKHEQRLAVLGAHVLGRAS